MNMIPKQFIPNALAIAVVIGYYLAGQYLGASSTSAIFKEVDLLTGNIILVIIAITIGLFVPQYWIVFLICNGVLVVSAAIPEVATSLNSSQAYITGAVLVVLGFSSIANFSRQRRSTKK